MGFPDAERAYGAVLRHAKRTCFRWIPGALKCFKGAGGPHRTPALMAGFNAVPCASAARRPSGSLLAWNNFFGDIGFPDAERAYGAVLRHAKRACFRWIPGALKCFKGAGGPHRTPALMAGFNAVPCASAARRPSGSLLAWNNFFGDIGFPDAERAYGAVLRHAKRACFRWIPGALDCFKGAGEPHRTPALMAGFNAVPCASAPRRAGAKTLSPQIAPRAAMIAEDFCRLRTTLASRSPSGSIAPPMVERACARKRQKDRRGRGQRSLYP